jgi:small subunit ribosomal protein S16
LISFEEKKAVVRIRLRRMGAKKRPFYRIVVAQQQAPRNGGFIENIGTYNPMTDPATVQLTHERAAYWLGVGAQPSDAVARLLKKANLLDANGKPVAVAAQENVAA